MGNESIYIYMFYADSRRKAERNIWNMSVAQSISFSFSHWFNRCAMAHVSARALSSTWVLHSDMFQLMWTVVQNFSSSI